jgi:GH24 family phage-related lysozyme (muramidase)
MSLPSNEWEVRLREVNAQVEYATSKTRIREEFEHLSDEQLIRDEGFASSVYQDSRGFWTIGILLEHFGKSVDDAQSPPELFQDISAAETADSRKTPDRAAAS